MPRAEVDTTQPEWHRIARRLLPDLLPPERRAASLADLLFDLCSRFVHGPVNDDLAGRAWAFAGYCFAPERHDAVRASVVNDFYRHLAAHPSLQHELARRFVSDFHRLLPGLEPVMAAEDFGPFAAVAAAARRPRELRSADLAQVARHASDHQRRVRAARQCGCYHCLALFSPAEITEWIEPVPGQSGEATALCPQCGIDAVLPDDIPDAPLTTELLHTLAIESFGTSPAGPPPDRGITRA